MECVPLPPSNSSSSSYANSSGVPEIFSKQCNLFRGEWVPNREAPYYTNATCSAIYDHQNCIKYGRPDNGFLKWRWKPDECELPLFDAAHFLQIVRGKSMAFVGDSVARNHMQSLICLLSMVEHPTDISYPSDNNSKHWLFKHYNFTIENFWSPFLVKSKETNPLTLPGVFNLYLNEADENWMTQIEKFDYVIVSAGHWFFRPIMYYEQGQLIGCHYCADKNVTYVTMSYAYGKAFRTSFEAINGLKNFKGMTFLRTFAPSHFENGKWNEGGDCLREKPFRSNETRLEDSSMELYMTQVKEFKVAKRRGKRRGLKYGLLDTTQAMLLRPDGHPGRYGHWQHLNVSWPKDCIHWCLPGPIDILNDFLLQIMKMKS